MESSQMGMAPAAPRFDSIIHEQLLDRQQRLREAREHTGANEDFSRLLNEVDAALARFDAGSFGVCIDCKDPVEPERLLNDPLMQVCLGCLTDAQRNALEDDLQLAADIQRGLLPRSGIACDTWRVEYAYHPAGIVSGDYVDIIEAGDQFYFVLGDVSGKGMAASLLMSNLHAIFHSLVPMDLPLVELMSRANRLLSESSPANQYATLVAGRANRGGHIEISNAGHLPPVLIKGGTKVELNHSGLPLGMFSEAEFTVNKVDLEQGDALVLFTDGVTEAVDQAGTEFGTQRLFDALGSGRPPEPGSLIEQCLAHIDDFRNGAGRPDDLTILAVSYA